MTIYTKKDKETLANLVATLLNAGFDVSLSNSGGGSVMIDISRHVTQEQNVTFDGNSLSRDWYSNVSTSTLPLNTKFTLDDQ